MKLRQILISAKLICQYRALRRYIYIAAVEAIFFGIFPKLLMESQKNGVFGNNLLNWSAIVLTGAIENATDEIQNLKNAIAKLGNTNAKQR